MSRSERLLELLQVLRAHRYPVSGAELARTTGVSMRTLYRDIASLRAQGAVIDGEQGVGYVLQPGFLLPPLMFTPDEIDALVLGARWVERNTDETLTASVKTALSKIAHVLPEKRDVEVAETGLFALTTPPEFANAGHEASVIRGALRHACKLRIHYNDSTDTETVRTIWPIALGYFDQIQLLLAWCELRQDYRRFRVDRLCQIERLNQRPSRNRKVMLREWLEKNDAAPQT